MKKIAIVINSRLSSSRLHKKAFYLINGISVINHLISRLLSVEVDIIVAVPFDEYNEYIREIKPAGPIKVHPSLHSEDPLKRMDEVCKTFGLDYAVRVTHDKIFVDTLLMKDALESLNEKQCDYIYCPDSTPGTGFEVISATALNTAANKFDRIEFIGYAVKEITNKTRKINQRSSLKRNDVRLLIDYEDDLQLMKILMGTLGPSSTLRQVINYLDEKPTLKQINRLPDVSVYTCAYNAAEWLQKAAKFVLIQKGIKFEYILVNDGSTDGTAEIMADIWVNNKEISFINNYQNYGLSSSSNIALQQAKGKYILRMDADDWFLDAYSLKRIFDFAEKQKSEIVYPDTMLCLNGDILEIQNAELNHHIGGALFLRSALNYLRFTDGLRGHDSLDIFLRAKDKLNISYFRFPIFAYNQRPQSLSRTNIDLRNRIKADLENSHA